MAPRGAPPATLTEHDLARLQDCRRQVAIGGVKGLVGGGLAGYAGARIGQQIIRTRYKDVQHLMQFTQRKYVTLATMLAGSAGSFVLAATYGRRTVSHIGDIFQRGATEHVVTDYQERTVADGGGLKRRQVQAEQAAHDSYTRRMTAVAEFKAKRESGIADRHGHKDPQYSDR